MTRIVLVPGGKVGVKVPGEGDRSPWGTIDSVHEECPGIYSVGTPGHGGVWVAPDLRKHLPAEYRRRAWFEEDCEYAIPFTIFALEIKRFTGRDVFESAVASWKAWNPDSFESFFGVVIPVEESFVKRTRKFEEDTKDKFVAQSANSVPNGKVKVFAKRASDGETGYWFVDGKRYRGSALGCGYVIDEAVDEATTGGGVSKVA